MNQNCQYEYKFWVTNLGDGGFNKVDNPLGQMLKDGFKPIRETVVNKDGLVLFVLSKPLNDTNVG